MPNEITITGGITLVNPLALTNTGFAPGPISLNQAGKNYKAGTMQLTTSPAAVPQGTVVVIGEGVFQNTGLTNDVYLRLGVGGTDTICIKPGRTSGPLHPVPGAAWYASSNAGTTSLDYFLTEV